MIGRNVGVDCSATDPSTSGTSQLAEDFEPPECVITRRGEGIGDSITLFSVNLGADGSYEVIHESDGEGGEEFFVDVAAGGELGVELTKGGSVDVIDGLKVGTSGTVGVGADASVTRTYAFDSLEDAEDFSQRLRDFARGPIQDLDEWQSYVPIYGSWHLYREQRERRKNLDPPAVSRTRIEGGINLRARGGAYGGGGSATGSASLGRSVGATIDHEEDTTTVYTEIAAELAAELGVGMPAGLSVDADGGVSTTLVLGVEFDSEGSPTELQVKWAGQAQGGIGLPSAEALWFAAGDPTSYGDMAKIGLDVDEQQTWALEAAATLDLDDPRLGTIGDDVVASLRADDVVGFVDAGHDLVEHVRDQSDVLVQYHSGELDETSLSADVGVGLAFGFDANYYSSDAELRDAWARRPGGNELIHDVCGTT